MRRYKVTLSMEVVEENEQSARDVFEECMGQCDTRDFEVEDLGEWQEEEVELEDLL